MIVKSDYLISNPLVSVVICSFNRSNYILQAVDSVLNQKTNFTVEIIIGDDGSTDNSRELLLEYQKKYPDQIVLLFQENNLGLGGNWASCIKLARANYIAPLDDDDYWCDSMKLQTQADFLEKNKDYSLIHTNYFNFYESINKKLLANPKIDKQPVNLMHSIFTGQYPINPGTVCFRKDLLLCYLDDYIINRFPIQDWPTWILLSAKFKFMYLDIPTLMYRKIEGNMSNPTSYNTIIQKYSKEKMMYKYICDLFSEDLPFDEKGYDIYLNGILLNLAYKKLDFRSAKMFAKASVELGAKNLKVKMALSKISFYLFGLLKRMK